MEPEARAHANARPSRFPNIQNPHYGPGRAAFCDLLLKMAQGSYPVLTEHGGPNGGKRGGAEDRGRGIQSHNMFPYASSLQAVRTSPVSSAVGPLGSG